MNNTNQLFEIILNLKSQIAVEKNQLFKIIDKSLIIDSYHKIPHFEVFSSKNELLLEISLQNTANSHKCETIIIKNYLGKDRFETGELTQLPFKAPIFNFTFYCNTYRVGKDDKDHTVEFFIFIDNENKVYKFQGYGIIKNPFDYNPNDKISKNRYEKLSKEIDNIISIISDFWVLKNDNLNIEYIHDIITYTDIPLIKTLSLNKIFDKEASINNLPSLLTLYLYSIVYKDFLDNQILKKNTQNLISNDKIHTIMNKGIICYKNVYIINSLNIGVYICIQNPGNRIFPSLTGFIPNEMILQIENCIQEIVLIQK